LKYTLEAFNEESTRGYIQHRLRLAGSNEEIFDPKAISMVHHYARGIPRLINTICDNSLFEGYLLRQKKIESQLVSSVVQDLGLSEEADRPVQLSQIPVGAVSRSRQPTPPPVGKRTVRVPTPPPVQTQAQNNDVDKVISGFDEMIEEQPAAAGRAGNNPGRLTTLISIPCSTTGKKVAAHGLPESLKLP